MLASLSLPGGVNTRSDSVKIVVAWESLLEPLLDRGCVCVLAIVEGCDDEGGNPEDMVDVYFKVADRM